MGKDWLHWLVGGGAAAAGGRSSARRGRRASVDMEESAAAAAASSAGCMCAVFQLFDLHHFQFPHQNINPSLHEDATATTSKGTEAPRNSLEEEGEEPIAAINAASSKPLPIKAEAANLNFPVGIQTTKTNKGGKSKTKTPSSSPRISCTKSRTEDFSSECSSSYSPAGSKTPSIVARLMGLDLLPESTSPSLSSSSTTLKNQRLQEYQKQSKNRASKNRASKHRAYFYDDDLSGGARSLPETPRISSARRSDVDLYHHRLSLQINKENLSEEYFSVSDDKRVSRRGRRLTNLQTQDENTMSPGNYAKQIAKHVRESVSRRVGKDITNTSRNGDHYRRDDENLILHKPTKDSNRASSCSPRLRFLESNNNTNSTAKSPRVFSSSSDNHTHKEKEKGDNNVGNGGKCGSSRLKKLLPHQASDHTIRNKKEETFVHSTNNKVNVTDKKSKRTPLSSDILNISSPTLLQIKRDPSPPPTKLPFKQTQVSDAASSKKSTQLSSKPSSSYKQPNKILRVLPDSTNGCATTIRGGAATEYGDYIRIILERADIIHDPLTWYTPSHPIDPSIFHHIELFSPTTANSAAVTGGNSILRHRCNRKLIFQLVNELLGEIIRPNFGFRPSISQIREDDQFRLIDELCEKIDDFPAANCLVLEDIDSLIDRDLRKSQFNVLFDEEVKQSIVCEIEGEIMEMLVRETVAVIGGCAAEEQRLTAATW